jgi:site-specific DNA-cytosine methylase
MQGGRVFRDVCSELGEPMSDLRADVLKAEHYGVAQRRWRVFVVARASGAAPAPPPPLSDFPVEAAELGGLAVTPGAADAIGDLPPLQQGEDKSDVPCAEATSDYQRFCRGEMTAEEYLDGLRGQQRPQVEVQLEPAA